jgi:hypothetical protein
MKHHKQYAIKYYAIILSVIIVSAFSLVGCAVITTTSTPASKKKIEGIVYHLPASLLKISFESKKDKGKHSELIVAVSPEIVPDKDARFTIDPSTNCDFLFSRKHTFNFTDGLLSSVAVEDEGKGGEIITKLAGIAMNVMSFGAPSIPPVRKGDKEISDSQNPSNQEIVEALNSITPGRHDFLFKPSKVFGGSLPGTGGLLQFRATIKDLPGTCSQKNTEENYENSIENYDGIVTRVLEPYKVKISLYIKLEELYKKRNTDLKATCKDDGKRNRMIERNKHFSMIYLNKLYRIDDHSSTILIPDFSPIVKIPIERSPLGTTKFNLTLNKGILTSYHAENPSIGLEIVKTVHDTLEAIVKIPANISPIKVDYPSESKALAESDAQLKELERENADLQKEIDRLKKDISELK